MLTPAYSHLCLGVMVVVFGVGGARLVQRPAQLAPGMRSYRLTTSESNSPGAIKSHWSCCVKSQGTWKSAGASSGGGKSRRARAAAVVVLLSSFFCLFEGKGISGRWGVSAPNLPSCFLNRGERMEWGFDPE